VDTYTCKATSGCKGTATHHITQRAFMARPALPSLACQDCVDRKLSPPLLAKPSLAARLDEMHGKGWNIMKPLGGGVFESKFYRVSPLR
jgi:hypothetical protein